MRKLLMMGALAGVCLAAEPASATTIFSDFGPGGSFACCQGVVVTSMLTNGDVFKEGAGFISPFDATLDQIDIALTHIGGPNTAIVSLHTDGGGGVPGSQIAAWTLSNFPDWFANPTTGAATISGISGIQLTAGTKYYLVAEPVDPTDDTWLAWNANTQGVLGDQPNFQNGQWYADTNVNQLAFDILGTPTTPIVPAPEPATIALFAGGIAGVVRLRRRKAQK